MKLDLEINGAEERIDVTQAPPLLRFRLGERPECAADAESPEPGVYSILIGGRAYEARVEEAPDGLVVTAGGHRFEIEVRDPRRSRRGSRGGGAGGIQNISAPMPGKVIRVLVAAGDAVEAGQGVAVVEAMKMQNEMKAARAGTVRSINVKEGAPVAAGDVLATIE